MQNAEWLKIKEVFNQTLDLPRNERDVFLATHNFAVQTEVRELIKSHENADEFIVEPAAIEFGLSRDLNIGQQIDDYKIISEIGVGGMGTVYLAERISFAQKVAVKLINRGMDTRAVLKRFKMERQILSRLNHPNIAKLLDGGETPEGLPYFVMEYIEGETITKFCEHQQFDVNERLELFQKVCNAIGYAHANLIVHRDIKPSNIIVTNDGTPKLLDFGIAKLLDNEIDNTATIGRMFTPEYASPEQINGLPITTATDVYSLGVVLYQILSGVRPFTSKSRNYGEIANLVLTVEPLRPSSVVSGRRSVVKNTSEMESQRTKDEGKKTKIRNLEGDLDNIILKALRKEPERRYQSVGDFAEDIKRHLNGLPVTATADTNRYRFSKFVRRHKQGTAISAAVSLLIFSLSGVAIYQGIAVTRERVKAERRLVETRKIANSLMFEIHDSLQNLPGATTARELLVKRALEYLSSLSKEATDNPALENELAAAYRKVGDIQGGYFAKTGKSSEALENYLNAYRIQTKLLNANSKDLELIKEFGITTIKLGEISYSSVGNVEDARRYFQESQKLYESLVIAEPNNALWKSKLAYIYSFTNGLSAEKGNYSEAEEYRIKSLKFNDDAIASAPEDSEVMIIASGIYSNIGNELGNPNLSDLDKLDEALELFQKALLIQRKLLDKEPSNILFKSRIGSAYVNLGNIRLEKGEINQALKEYETALKIHKELSNSDLNDIYLRSMVAYEEKQTGLALLKSGRTDDAIEYQKKSVASFENIHSNDSNNIGFMLTLGICYADLADSLQKKGKLSEAFDSLKRSLAILEKSNSIAETSETRVYVAQTLLKLGKHTKNCQPNVNYYQKSYEMFEKAKEKNRLSSTNNQMRLEAEKMAKITDCK